ncbi:MAG TPA: hypothetical protein VMU90_07725 [Solirubrobacteraceae bacterium]|nr:hypothetical protein [Solirubrobacteraceae bacterium]
MGTIQLTTKFFFLAFLLYLFPAWARVDDEAAVKVGWGTNDLQVPAGTRRIEVYFPYIFMPKAGRNDIQVDVAEGQTVKVTYKAPWLVFLKGKLQVG